MKAVRHIDYKCNVVVNAPEDVGNCEWIIDNKCLRKIQKIISTLKPAARIEKIEGLTEKYLSCMIIDSEGNHVCCINEVVIRKTGNVIEVLQDPGRHLENEILRTVPKKIEKDVLNMINGANNTT